MARYDISDEIVIDAEPEEVFRALVDEMDGRSQLWEPARTNALREGRSFGDVGSVVHSTIKVHGRWPVRFTTVTVEVTEAEMIHLDYVGGSFTGEGLWRLERVGDTTRLSYRWRTEPTGLLRLLALVLPIAASHSTATRAELEKLRAALE